MIAIKVENLTKAYQIGQFTTGTLSRDIERWWALARGKEDPFLTIGETNDRSKKGKSDIVWSLKDLNFEIEHGEAIGIIGKNGAGKSTLLKILSQVTMPTAGTVKLKGRVASLLEVGTGFHPELTGRENIFLNGAIMGMRKSEIKLKFDEIVDFSGVDRYIDTPVKRYSSGMYVRLAFAVAAYLESEILVVDEVLAVGDYEFQKKCLSKMGDLSKGEGRTILFVSHNLQSISSLCTKAIVLVNGEIKCNTNVTEAIDFYQKSIISGNNTIEQSRIGGSGQVRIQSIKIKDNQGIIYYNQEICFEFELISNSNETINNISLWFGFSDLKNNTVINSFSKEKVEILPFATAILFVTLPPNRNLMPGEYQVGFNLAKNVSGVNYEPLDMVVGYPVFRVIIGQDTGDNPVSMVSYWPQGWGSIAYENNIRIENKL
ncbi:MAG: ABC transporter ATP-binding protein [Bacteroidota bacterium]|nr:ABC transporter ATP-binding protein [Bacteroidota bacterium]